MGAEWLAALDEDAADTARRVMQQITALGRADRMEEAFELASRTPKLVPPSYWGMVLSELRRYDEVRRAAWRAPFPARRERAGNVLSADAPSRQYDTSTDTPFPLSSLPPRFRSPSGVVLPRPHDKKTRENKRHEKEAPSRTRRNRALFAAALAAVWLPQARDLAATLRGRRRAALCPGAYNGLPRRVQR